MIETQILTGVKAAISELYKAEIPDQMVQIQKTRVEFEGDYTVVVFPILRNSNKCPEQTAEDI